MPDALPDLHASVLEDVMATLCADPRIDALLGGGSLVHGDLDAHSDLDLVVLVRAPDYPEVMASRREIAARLGGLLAAFTGEHVGEPRLLICLYGPPLLHVDLKFVVAADLHALVEHPRLLWARDRPAVETLLAQARVQWPQHDAQWFEDRAWIWLHYGATKLRRGELFEALGLLAYFRDQVLGPLLHRRAGRPQRGVRRIEHDAAATAALAPTSATCDSIAISRALHEALALYVALRQDAPPASPTPGMPRALLGFLEER